MWTKGVHDQPSLLEQAISQQYRTGVNGRSHDPATNRDALAGRSIIGDEEQSRRRFNRRKRRLVATPLGPGPDRADRGSVAIPQDCERPGETPEFAVAAAHRDVEAT